MHRQLAREHANLIDPWTHIRWWNALTAVFHIPKELDPLHQSPPTHGIAWDPRRPPPQVPVPNTEETPPKYHVHELGETIYDAPEFPGPPEPDVSGFDREDNQGREIAQRPRRLWQNEVKLARIRRIAGAEWIEKHALYWLAEDGFTKEELVQELMQRSTHHTHNPDLAVSMLRAGARGTACSPIPIVKSDSLENSSSAEGEEDMESSADEA
jgi:hypothetical protein